MSKVQNILDDKAINTIYAVEPTISVFNAIEIMADKNIGGLMIQENGKLVGIFTERDYARKLILKGRSSKDTLIGDLMTRDPYTVTPQSSIEECMTLMSGKRIRHLPVVENDKLVGIISISDVVRYIIEEQKSIIEHLESYITGQR
jgi:CBS domain-containing protein